MAGYKGILGYAQQALRENPNVRDNPDFAEMVRAIEQNDAQAGMALAQKILQQNGVSKEAAINRGIQVFNFPTR